MTSELFSDFMEKESESALFKCSWDGDPTGWSDFVRRVRLLYERTPRKKRRQLGPSLVSQLKDRAWATCWMLLP